jgi:hypothetical protein
MVLMSYSNGVQGMTMLDEAVRGEVRKAAFYAEELESYCTRIERATAGDAKASRVGADEETRRRQAQLEETLRGIVAAVPQLSTVDLADEIARLGVETGQNAIGHMLVAHALRAITAGQNPWATN